MAIKKSQENRMIYCCMVCYYNTFNRYDFEKHANTIKHKNNKLEMIPCDLSNNLSQKSQEHKFKCKKCNKIYKDYSGLWKHKKKCKIDNIFLEKNKDINEIEKKHLQKETTVDKELVIMLIKQNSELIKENNEFKNIMMEQQNIMLKVIENGTNNTTNNNSHNKSFNLQFFLNETCKDAMNITDFIDSIKLQLSDLERVGELGYIEGISSIIVKSLKELDVTQRPVHCTDKKREVLYIKDDDKWEKDEEKKKMHKIVKRIADKNARLLPKFKQAHPDCIKASSPFSDQYNKIIIESMGGPGDNDYEKEEKIIKNVSKEVIVEKSL
jgi:hypothetical protein